jgi:4-amino-4-deoxy-L-arabinose transferase-like glycosyltransferase
MGCAYLLIRIIRTGNAKLWLWFGVLAGVGLENKHSMLIFGFGIVVGLALTRERRWLRSPWFWAGGATAFLIFLPNLYGTSSTTSLSSNCRPISAEADGMCHSHR